MYVTAVRESLPWWVTVSAASDADEKLLDWLQAFLKAGDPAARLTYLRDCAARFEEECADSAAWGRYKCGCQATAVRKTKLFCDRHHMPFPSAAAGPAADASGTGADAG